MLTIEYYIAKIIGKIRRDKNKETLNRWFAKKGVHLPSGGGERAYQL